MEVEGSLQMLFLRFCKTIGVLSLPETTTGNHTTVARAFYEAMQALYVYRRCEI
jgi:hypothetical protein